jgi:hypothetical protein
MSPLTTRWCWACSLAFVSCVQASSEVTLNIPLSADASVALTAHRGELRWEGLSSAASRWVIEGELTLRAASRARAERRLSDSRLVVVEEGADVSATLESPQRVAIDADVWVPKDVLASVSIPRGTLIMSDFSGGLQIDASRVELWDASSGLNARVGSGGALMRLAPDANSEVIIELQQGDLWLQLPIGLPYHLRIEGFPDADWMVGPLGLVDVVELPGLYEGRAGEASVRVSIQSWGGAVWVEGY